MTNKIDNITSVPDIYAPGVSISRSETEVNQLMQQYIAGLANAPKYQEPIYDLDIFDFLGMVKLCLEARQDTEGVLRGNRINFFEDDPPEEVNTETISFSLAARVPGQFDRGPIGQGGVKELTSHLRYHIDHPTIPGQKLLTYGKRYETLINFYTYAKTTKESLRRALWFEKVMDSFHWCFRLHGFRPFEDGIGKKESVTIGELDLVKYPISYRIQTEDTYHLTTQELRKLLLDISVFK